MKRKTHFIRAALFFMMLLAGHKVSAQPGVDWQLVGNVTFPGNFLGTTNAQPLHLETLLGQPMRFRTNFGTATPGFGNRMIIVDGAFGPVGGRIAMGNNLPDGFAPVDRLHLHQTGAAVFLRITNALSGPFANDGFNIGINGGILSHAECHQFEDARIDFFTTSASIHQQRFRIWHDGLNQPRIGIGTIATFPFGRPLTYLHIGGGVNTVNTGYRSWMNVGTLYVTDTIGSPDNMYVGLRQYSNDKIEAIINWGNNPAVSGAADRLRFVFTSFPGNGTASTFNGLELGRMVVQTVSPGVVEGYTGFGDFLNAGTDPQNTVEINSLAPSPNTPGGSSGLRLTDLTAITPTITNPGLGVLAVNGSGDVIYVPSGLSFGSICGSLNPLQLQGLSEIQLNNFDFHFSGQGGFNNNVGIGTNCFNPLGGKLSVLQNSTNTNSIGILVENRDLGTGATFPSIAIGLKSTMSVSSPNLFRVAGFFETQTSIGIQGAAIVVPQNGGSIQVGFPNLQFSSCLIDANGTVCSMGVALFSDASLKNNIQTIENGLSKVVNLRGISFAWNQANDSAMAGTHFGFVAQEVESVLPDIVDTEPSGLKTLANTEIIPFLVEAIKELKLQVDSLASSSRIGSGNTQVIELESDIILYQNAPNPFSNETTIRYFIPDNGSNARMLFFDETGRIIKEETIQNLGDGAVTLKTFGLSSGIYTYALEVNGKIIQTRKMQKIK